MAKETPWGGVILIVLGAILLLSTLDIVPIDDVLRFWPVLLILVGLKLVMQQRDRNRPPDAPPAAPDEEPPPPPPQ